MMAKNDVTRQTLERDYYKLLDRMCDCHSLLTSIVMNASYSKPVKDVTDLHVRDLRELIEATHRGLQEVIARQMKTKTTVEP